MRPSARSLVCGKHWSRKASKRFVSLVRRCALLVKVFSVVHSVLHVDVYCCLGTLGTINIRDILISEGHAELAEESYESKVSACVLRSTCGWLCVWGRGALLLQRPAAWVESPCVM